MKKILLATAIFCFQLSFATAQETIVDGVAAVVGKNIVKYSDIDRAYAQMRLRSGNENPFESKCTILENLILNQLLVHKGEVDSIEVTDEEVDEYAQEYLENDLQQYGTKEALREATGFTYDELKEQYQRMLRNYILGQRVQYQLTQDVNITPHEVTDFFNSLPPDSLPEMPERYELSEIEMQPVISEAERDRVVGVGLAHDFEQGLSARGDAAGGASGVDDVEFALLARHAHQPSVREGEPGLWAAVLRIGDDGDGVAAHRRAPRLAAGELASVLPLGAHEHAREAVRLVEDPAAVVERHELRLERGNAPSESEQRRTLHA